MAVAFDAVSTNQAGSGTTLTVSHTASGSDRYAICAVGAGDDRTISGVTYNGVSMTLIDDITSGGGTAAFYGLLNPPTGANDVVATFSGSCTCTIAVATYTGVDQTTPYDGLNTATGTSTSASVTVTSATDNLVVGAMSSFSFGTRTHTATGTGQTQRSSLLDGNDQIRVSLSDQTGAASTSQSYTLSASVLWNIGAVNVIAAGAGADTLTIDSQPSTATSGVAMGNVTISSSDTGSTATVTATIASGGGSLSGTTSGAMSAGTITFSNLIITGTGAHTLAFNATGHDEVISSTITVSSGGPSAGAKFTQNRINTKETDMRVIPSNTATAALRRIPFTLVDATDGFTPEDITVTGVKVALSIDGGTSANSTNDIVKVDGGTGRYYLELTQAEANQTAGAIAFGRLAPSGCWPREIAAQIGPAEVFAATVTLADGGLTAAKFGASAITSTVLADNAITAAKINADAITNAKIADNAIAAENIASNAITAAKIATDAITSAQLAASAVTEIQTGLATSAALTTVDNEIATLQTTADAIEADTQNIQSRIPAALAGGKMVADATSLGGVPIGEGGVAPGSPIGEVAP